VLGDPKQMEDSLVSVLQNRPDDCEIIVVLNRAYDDPYDLQGEVRFVEAARGSRMVDSLNLGVGLSRAAVVHLLTCGVTVTEGWADRAMVHFQDPAVAAVAPLVVDAANPQRLICAGAAYHPSGRIRKLAARFAAEGPFPAEALVDPDLPVAFYRTALLKRVGPFSRHAGDWLSGLDMALALTQAGFRCVLEPQCRLRAGSLGEYRQGAGHRAWGAERLFWSWIPPAARFRCLAMHALLVAAEWGVRLPRPAGIAGLAGRLIGAVQAAFSRSRRQLPAPAAPSVVLPAAAGEVAHFHSAHPAMNRVGRPLEPAPAPGYADSEG
jgi:hypothetical protein